MANNEVSVLVCALQNPDVSEGSLSTETFCTGLAKKRFFERKNFEGHQEQNPLLFSTYLWDI